MSEFARLTKLKDEIEAKLAELTGGYYDCDMTDDYWFEDSGQVQAKRL